MRKNKLENLKSLDENQFIESVRDKLDELEILRKHKKKIYERRKSISIPLAILVTPILGYMDWLLLLAQSRSDDSAAGLSIAFLGIIYGWVTQPKRDYSKSYKKEILQGLAHTLGLTYGSGTKIPVAEMQPSKIVPRHDRYNVDDYFEGTYKGVFIRFAEINLEQRRRNKNRTYYVSVFKGLAILLDLGHKRFYGHTIMTKDQKRLLKWMKEKSSGLDRANLVDPEFEKIFDVFTSDQVEARYLIDPAMIEEINTLQAEYEGKKLMAAFYDSKMLIMLASKHNHFEPADLHTKATSPESIKHMRREIVEILDIIDRLDLYDPKSLKRK